MRTFNHVGIVTTESKEGAVYNEGLSVWLTDYSKSPNRIEFFENSRKAAAYRSWYRPMAISLIRFLVWKKSWKVRR